MFIKTLPPEHTVITNPINEKSRWEGGEDGEDGLRGGRCQGALLSGIKGMPLYLDFLLKPME